MLILAATALNAVMRSRPVEASARYIRVKLATYRAKKPHTASTTRESIDLVPIRTGMCALGCTRRVISRIPCLTSNSKRITLIPPPVEPAQPPTKLENSNRMAMKPGQL